MRKIFRISGLCCLLQTGTVWVNRGYSTTVLSSTSFLTYFSEVLIQLPTYNYQGLTFPAVVTQRAWHHSAQFTAGEVSFCCQVGNVLETCPSIVPLPGDKHRKSRAQGQDDQGLQSTVTDILFIMSIRIQISMVIGKLRKKQQSSYFPNF